MGIITGLLYFVFIVSSILLIAIVLLQEGKGGGLAEAFGGVGAETFGVKSGGINKATASIAAIFLVSAILVSLIAKTERDTGSVKLESDGKITAPAGGDSGAGSGGATEGAGGATEGGANDE
ncbi:MAG: preprotein translocase subunit SecG [Planctomycetota bacterium]